MTGKPPVGKSQAAQPKYKRALVPGINSLRPHEILVSWSHCIIRTCVPGRWLQAMAADAEDVLSQPALN